MPERQTLLAAFTVGACALVPAVAVGCGGDDNDDSTEAATTEEATTQASTTATAPAGAASTLKVDETDFALSPANPTVKAGTVTIDVSNSGQTEHSLEVEGPNGEKELETPLAPGDKGSLEVDLSKPGTYTWYCPVDDHKGMGMEGKITVTATVK